MEKRKVQGRTQQNKTKQNKTKQNKTKKNKTKPKPKTKTKTKKTLEKKIQEQSRKMALLSLFLFLFLSVFLSFVPTHIYPGPVSDYSCICTSYNVLLDQITNLAATQVFKAPMIMISTHHSSYRHLEIGGGGGHSLKMGYRYVHPWRPLFTPSWLFARPPLQHFSVLKTLLSPHITNF